MTYQTPPEELADLVELKPDPLMLFGPRPDWMLICDRPAFPNIEELTQPKLTLAGTKINPRLFCPDRLRPYRQPRLRNIRTGEERDIHGLPENVGLNYPSWSPMGDRLAFCVSEDEGLQLWVVDFESLEAKAVGPANLNNTLGGAPYDWRSETELVVQRRLPDQGKPPEKTSSGPTVRDSSGREAGNRTYTNLLKTKHDEALFTYYASSQMYWHDLNSSREKAWAEAGIIDRVSPSPDGQYALMIYIEAPFSYRVPYSKFPDQVVIVDRAGEVVHTICHRQAADSLAPVFGAVIDEPRRFNWRSDVPATLYWVQAQDGGDPREEVEFRDQLYHLSAPFQGEAVAGLKLPLRYGGIYWGRGDLAIVVEWRWKDRRQVTRRWYPDEEGTRPVEVLFDQSWEDRYKDPGNFVTVRPRSKPPVLLTRDEGRKLLLVGAGHAEEGQAPFIDEYDLATGNTERLWQSQSPYYERPSLILDEQPDYFVLSRESKTERPNFFLRKIDGSEEVRITYLPHPYPKLRDAQMELVRYQRKDGVQLSGELHLPAGYEPKRDGPRPVLMWAYPREYKDAEAAGQVLVSPYEFTRVSPMSPLAWLSRGFVILDDFGMPIVGEGEAEPNETFIEQVQLNAQAAIDKLMEMGVADPKRIYVGGHSYGAFMTAHLLAHTDLFAGGIARSGAYNRTLTPFGFQTEERTFWQVPEVYMKLSPFVHADKIDAPLLLIHGAEDSNSGTYPLQSERMFDALNDLGKTARLVLLPHEDHGYSARESILHMLYEMDRWMVANS
ncbi:MAG: prolyl oligopeptidase family serine peptidase [Bacteroidota bacterium]